MKVLATNSFLESLDRISLQRTWIYRIYLLFKSDIPNFFKNIWLFRKVLWHHRWWDYRYPLEALRTSLEIMEKGMHNGLEVRESRDKKIAKMQRAIEILKNIEGDRYLELAEKKMGKEYFVGEWIFSPVKDKDGSYEINSKISKGQEKINKQISNLSDKIEAEEWNELWQIFKGQDYKKFKATEDWNKQFDGTGLKGWWD